jgi:hypothetical protein
MFAVIDRRHFGSMRGRVCSPLTLDTLPRSGLRLISLTMIFPD